MLRITIENLKEIVKRINAPISAHMSNNSNPHKVTKAQIGLSNADNTSDINKPISNAVKKEIGLLQGDIFVLKNGSAIDGGYLTDTTPATNSYDGGDL